MPMHTEGSHALFTRAQALLPGGVNSPVRAFKSVGGEPFFVQRAEGPYLYDVDGNRYIDYVGSWGPMIAGHNHPRVLEAVIATARNGLSFGTPNPLEVTMAETITRLVPSCEMVRMVNSGTEATLSAIRLARGATGRSRIVKFEGCYHGHGDSFLVKAGSGALTFGVTSAMVFCRSREGLDSPDLQLLFTPASYVFGKALVLEDQPGMTVAVCPTRPGSRGTVLIDSADPTARPKIRYGYATDRDDLRVMTAGLAHARSIFAAPAFSNYIVEETRPGNAVTDNSQVEEFVRREGSSLYHPVGTCKMGIDDAAVVDPRLKVRGIEGLRVADSSIMPYLTTGNTNAPTIMIGEKAADLIIEDARKAA